MELAFYKAFQPKATITDNIIALASFGKYSHVEIVFPDECFSVSARDKVGRFKKIDVNSGSWDILELHPDIPCEDLRENASKYLGYKYDYLGALFSITPLCIQRDDKIFCSEVVTNLLNKYPVYNLGDGCKYSPSELYSQIQRINNRL